MKSVVIEERGGLRIANQAGNATVVLNDKSLTEKSQQKSLGKLLGCGAVPWSNNFEVTEDMRQAAIEFRDGFATPDAYKHLDVASKKALLKANEQRDIAIENAILCLKRQMEIETEKMVADLRQM